MKKISIKHDFKTDYITREAGERLRFFILESYKKNELIEIDFSDIIVASTSFFDEGIAKLQKEGWDFKKLNKFLKLKSINPLDKEVMISVCKLRGME